MKKKYILFAAILTGCRLFAPEKSDAVAKTTDGEGVSPAVTQNRAIISPPLKPKRFSLTLEEHIEIIKNLPPLASLDSSEDDDEQEVIRVRGTEQLIFSKGEQKRIIRKFCRPPRSILEGEVRNLYYIKDIDGLDLEKYTRQALFLAYENKKRVCPKDRADLQTRLKEWAKVNEDIMSEGDFFKELVKKAGPKAGPTC